ncbi:hypothetical protein [Actinomadura roseirufa]|uniref:hypothetical protein n=1 Tax=Actinomadura roseirufa TaxID=2094049 RepID=UPI0010419FFF|nr:hypothetical protein [Actinomadura roseirufa]
MPDLNDRIAELHTANRSPSPETEETARARLMSEMNRPGRPRLRRPGAGRPSAKKWRVTLVSGLTAAVVAVAGWGVISWYNRPLYSPEPLAGYSGPAANFLLAAADARAREGGAGAVWYRHAVAGGTVMAKSPYRKGVTYPMEIEGDEFLVASSKPFTGSAPAHPTTHLEWPGDQLRGRPATAAARKEWNTDLRPEPDELGVEAPGRSIGPAMGGGTVLDVSDETARRLPTDPAELRAWLLNHATRTDHKRLRDPDLFLFQSASFLLVDAPVSDKVRIATYRLLASLKNVRLGTATDARGRSGKAISMRETSSASGTVDWQLLIDPRNGRLTASQQILVAPGRLNAGLPASVRWYYEVIETAEWTNKPASSLVPKSLNTGPDAGQRP